MDEIIAASFVMPEGVRAVGAALIGGRICDATARLTGGDRNAPKEFEIMCRSIKILHNFEPAATEAEIRAAAVQFVRKLSGFAQPSQANQPAFDRAVDQVTAAARELLAGLVTRAPPRNREAEAAKARVRSMAQSRGA